MPPAGKRHYRRPAVKRTAEPRKRPASAAERDLRVVALEESLGHYFSLARRLEGLERGKPPDRERIGAYGNLLKASKTGIRKSIEEIAKNYTLSDMQKGILKQVVDSLNKPTKEMQHETMSLTCGLKRED